MPTIINQQWLSSNGQRSYPIASSASKTDLTGAFEIPDDFILGIYLPIHAGLNVQPGKFYISSLAIFSAGFRITISYDDDTDSPPVVATAVVPRATHVENNTYNLIGQDDFIDTAGQIVIGRLSTVLTRPPGEYAFDLEGTQLEADAVQPMIQFVSGMVLVNGNNRSSRLTGDIELVAGTNIQLTVTDAATANPKVRIDAIAGEGLNEDCVCDEITTEPIRTINGVPPTANGNFTFLGGTCVNITAIDNGLKFIDECSQPCCDCPELTALTEELEFFGSEARTTQNFINRLTSNVDNMTNVILGSVLGDSSCLDCSTE